MGVYIKGMEMPKRGHTITITIVGSGQAYVEYFDCRPHVKETIEYTAVPVPPHGKMIDADALYTRMKKAHTDWREHPEQYNGVIPVNADEIFVLTEAVIIPAEEGER